MAPQVGFEPTTDRLTADSSTTELLWNGIKKLPGGVLLSRDVSPTTIGAGELNCCVRHGNRCGLSAIAAGQCACDTHMVSQWGCSTLSNEWLSVSIYTQNRIEAMHVKIIYTGYILNKSSID